MTGTVLLIACVIFWLVAWYINTRLSRITTKDQKLQMSINLAIPVLFGAALLALWEGVTTGFGVPTDILPPPSMIWSRIVSSVPTLWADFQQTYLKAVLSGYVMGCGLGFMTAILVERSAFWKAGIMPVGNLVSALPIIGIAIAVGVFQEEDGIFALVSKNRLRRGRGGRGEQCRG